VEIRPPAPPDEPPGPPPDRPDAGTGPGAAPRVARDPHPVPDLPPARAVAWRVDGRMRLARLAGVIVFAAAAYLFRGDRVGTSLSVLAALLCAGYGLRDLIAPVRLAADPDGVSVTTGYARRTRLSWPQVERIRVDRRSRLGNPTELLEIDTGERLYLFSARDLGVRPADALAVLAALRTGG